MPTYKVIARGFHGDKLYDPEGKRKTLTTDKPFTKGAKSKNPIPSWLSEMPEESPAIKEKREALTKAKADLADAKNPATPGTAAAALQQGVSDQEQIAIASTEGDGADASFLGGNTANSNVETL
jgi:hypothetical protein